MMKWLRISLWIDEHTQCGLSLSQTLGKSQCHRQGGNRDSLSWAPSVRGPPNSARQVQIRSGLSVTFQSSFFKGFVSLYFRLKSTCFTFYVADANVRLMHNNLTWLLCSLLARAPYIVLFNLKPLNEDGNLQVHMYCVHARKRASGTTRTQISKFPGACPQAPLHNPYCGAPLIVFTLAFPPPILLVALARVWA